MGAKFRGFCCKNWFPLNLGWFHKLFTSLCLLPGHFSPLHSALPASSHLGAFPALQAEGLPCPVS